MFTMCDCASLITQKNRLDWGFCGKMSRLNQTSGMWQPCGGIRSCEGEANTPRGIWIQKSTFQVVPRLHWLVSLSDADISLSSLCLIFHLRPRTTTTAAKLNPFVMRALFSLDIFQGSLPLHKNVICYTNVCPWNFFSPLCCLALCQET